MVKKVTKKKGRTKTKKAPKKTMRALEDATVFTVCGGMQGVPPFPQGLEDALEGLVEAFPYLEGKTIVYNSE